MPKIAVVGKGGAGKTMLASVLSYVFAENGKRVYAIDADPNPTLGQALGFPKELLDAVKPIILLKELIRERVGAGTDAYGSYFRLNPRVDDIPDRFSAKHRSIQLLVMGATRGMNTGCACPENTLVKALINHLVLQTNETVLIDMVAGTEHIGRGTSSGVDCMFIVVEPSNRSILAAESIITLTAGFRSLRRRIVGNKVKDASDEEIIRRAFPDSEIAGFIGWHREILDAENEGIPVYDKVPDVANRVKDIVTRSGIAV